MASKFDHMVGNDFKTVLVTGANGQDGSYLIERLVGEAALCTGSATPRRARQGSGSVSQRYRTRG